MTEREPAPAGAAEADRAEAEPEQAEPRGSVALYLLAFFLVLASFVAMGLGGLSLLGRGVDVSPTGLFWASMALSVLALVAGVAALLVRRRP